MRGLRGHIGCPTCRVQAGSWQPAIPAGRAPGPAKRPSGPVRQAFDGLPWRQAVYSGSSYYLVWPKAHRAQARLQRLRDYLLAEVAAMRLPEVQRL